VLHRHRAAIFPGARLEAGAEVRIHGVVHVNTRVLAGDTVPIGWVAVGDPAQIMPPDRHEDIWRIQRELDFPGTVYGVPRGTPPAVRMRRQVEWYGAHRGDRIIEGSRGPSPGWTGGAVPERVSRRGSGAPWEAVAGYSRAVRAGPLLLVAGTTATGPDGDVGPEGDLHGQTLRALENVREAVERAGARLDQVVGTRMFVTDIRRWEEAARAHGEVFGEIRPVTAMVEVSALIDPRMLVEVEATAWLASSVDEGVAERE
jgi:enamine deaminase RidA (YjgF/YER057c/UK114 family)